jgi:hypothetical protein
MSRRVCALLVCAIAAGCGGSATAPLAPSSVPATASSPTSTATITGAVQTPAGTAAGMIVDLVGSSLRTAVDGDNRFAFAGVPAGQHRLRFSGAGANAEVALDPVASGETMNVVIAVSGASASVQSGHKIGVNETRFEGRIASIDTAAGTIVIGERTVTTSGSTVLKDGSRAIALTALTETMLVEVTGVQGETSFAARLIDVLPDPKLNLDGTVAGLTGTAAAFEFTLGSRRIAGGASTDFKGGPNPSFARLANGVAVHVAALDKGTFAEATRINLQEDPSATPTSATGTLTAIDGDAPVLTLTVGTSTVLTDAATVVRQGNLTLTLAALAVGQTLAVEGTLGLDGITFTASRIQIEGSPAPAPEPQPVAFDAEGTVSALAGTCPAVTFTLQEKTIAVNAATHYVQVTCGALANGTTLRVKGTLQGDGTVVATMVQFKKK